MESADSIRSPYRHFLSGITTKSLNAFYYSCSYAKVDCSVFMNVTARLSLRLVPADLRSQPFFLCIDDTMVSKFGKKFEDVSKLFDHIFSELPHRQSKLRPQTEREMFLFGSLLSFVHYWFSSYCINR